MSDQITKVEKRALHTVKSTSTYEKYKEEEDNTLAYTSIIEGTINTRFRVLQLPFIAIITLWVNINSVVPAIAAA